MRAKRRLDANLGAYPPLCDPFFPESKGLEMKTYTLTWHDSIRMTKNHICRCRFEPSCLYWSFRSNIGGSSDVISAFVFAMCKNPKRRYSFRLTSCGRLVARSATYQGV